LWDDISHFEDHLKAWEEAAGTKVQPASEQLKREEDDEAGDAK
jgi:hypothetical protein